MDHPSGRKSDDLGFVPVVSSFTPGLKPDSLLIGRPCEGKSQKVSDILSGYGSKFSRSGQEKVNQLTGVPSGGILGGSKGLRSDDTKQFDLTLEHNYSQREVQEWQDSTGFDKVLHSEMLHTDRLEGVNRLDRPTSL